MTTKKTTPKSTDKAAERITKGLQKNLGNAKPRVSKKAVDKKTDEEIDRAVELEGLPENLKKAIAKRRQGTTATSDPAAAPVTQELTAISLARITPSPLNPRKNFSGPPFEELVESVRAKGVISPIMVRPHGKEGDFEIIYGERRWRAACRIAKENGGLAKHTIPALVRRIDEAEAFDLMTIENLKRADLTELEEAMSFKQYVDRNGEESLVVLAERTGINAAYIRRRIMVMNLPECILQEWDAGTIKYGHLEQLARLGDNQERLEQVFKQVMESARYHDGIMTVERLKHIIASDSPHLGVALFDPEGEGCLSCFHNSDVQKNLFALDSGDVRCNKPECFMRKKADWLRANWEEFRRRQKLTTNGFVFHEVVGFGTYRQIQDWQKRSDKCKECPNFLSLLHLNTIEAENACFGDEKCYNIEILGRGKKETSVGADGDKRAGVVDAAPRVEWHGKYFRDLFFQARLPVRITEVEDRDIRVQRLALFSFVRNVRHLHPWLARTAHLRPEEKIDQWTNLSDQEIFDAVKGLDESQVAGMFKDAALASVLGDEHATTPRKIFADHLGVDVATEWSITEEYLQKKVKSEIIAFIAGQQLADNRDFANYLSTRHNCLSGDLAKLKKDQLVDALLNSGVNLVGKVPAEILSVSEVN